MEVGEKYLRFGKLGDIKEIDSLSFICIEVEVKVRFKDDIFRWKGKNDISVDLKYLFL